MSAGRKSFVLFKTTTKKIPCCLGNTLLRLLHLKRDSVGYSTYMLRKSKKIGWGGGSLGPIKAAHAAALCQKLLTSQRGREQRRQKLLALLMRREFDAHSLKGGRMAKPSAPECGSSIKKSTAEGSQFSADSLNRSASLMGCGRCHRDEGAD